MSPHAPPHLAKIAPVLLAGEDVRWMGKPNVARLLILEVVAAAGSFVVLFIIMSVFAVDLPNYMKAGISAVAAVAGMAILHFLVGMRTYVITDQRLLIITSFTSDVHDSCELSEIESIRKPGFGNSLIITRRNNPKPIRLWALGNRDYVEQTLIQQ
jgi:hypothetical protein